MSTAFGDARTIPASDEAKRIMNQLKAKELFPEQRDVWTLGAALGIASGKTHESRTRGTFQNINSLDSDETFAAVMLGRYPDMSPEERLKKLVDHAEWGIREIWRKHENGTLDFSTLGPSV
jgi:hypothetical protein